MSKDKAIEANYTNTYKLMKNSKYNDRSKSKGWFPIKQHRFDTSKHPCVVSEEKCASPLRAMFSPNELKMLDGLTNVLQVSEREAIRIALYEMVRATTTNPLEHKDKCLLVSDAPNHTGRNKAVSVRIPKVEQVSAMDYCQQFGLKSSEGIRLAVIWLAHSVRNGELWRLTKSPKIGQDELAKAWSREHEGAEPKLKNLKEAASKSWNEAWDYYDRQAKERYEARGNWLLQQNTGNYHQLMADGEGYDWTTVDAQIEIQNQEQEETWRQQIGEEDYLMVKATEIQDLEGITYEEALELATAMFAGSEEDELTDEEAQRIMDELDRCG